MGERKALAAGSHSSREWLRFRADLRVVFCDEPVKRRSLRRGLGPRLAGHQVEMLEKVPYYRMLTVEPLAGFRRKSFGAMLASSRWRVCFSRRTFFFRSPP